MEPKASFYCVSALKFEIQTNLNHINNPDWGGRNKNLVLVNLSNSPSFILFLYYPQVYCITCFYACSIFTKSTLQVSTALKQLSNCTPTHQIFFISHIDYPYATFPISSSTSPFVFLLYLACYCLCFLSPPYHYSHGFYGFYSQGPWFSLMASFRLFLIRNVSVDSSTAAPGLPCLNVPVTQRNTPPPLPLGTHSIQGLTSVRSPPNRLICLCVGTWFTQQALWVL